MKPQKLCGKWIGVVEGFPFMRRLGNVPGALFCETGLEWHSDGLDSLTALHCIETPKNGTGETLFANAFDIFDRLSPEEQWNAMKTTVLYSDRFTSGTGIPSAIDFQCGLRMNPFGTKLSCPVQVRLKAFNKKNSYMLPLVNVNRQNGRNFTPL